MKLAAGSSAQRYNMVHQRKGAFWDDRYHATAIQTDIHLLRCITYVDCNMVRAGRVTHPIQWPWGSYAELQGLRQRYRLVDLDLLADLMGVHSRDELQVRHKELVEQALAEGCQHDDTWTESIAVGSQGFVESVKKRLKGRANHRKVEGNNVVWALREDHNPYGEEYIAPGNEYSWEAEHMAFDAFTKLRP
jgi:putative transposase